MKKIFCTICAFLFLIGCYAEPSNSTKQLEQKADNDSDYSFVDEIVNFNEAMKEQGNEIYRYGDEVSIKAISKDYLLVKFSHPSSLSLYDIKKEQLISFGSYLKRDSYEAHAMCSCNFNDIYYDNDENIINFKIGEYDIFMFGSYFPNRLDFNIDTKQTEKMYLPINNQSCLYKLGVNPISEVYIKDTLLKYNKCSIFFEPKDEEQLEYTDNIFPIIEYSYTQRDKKVSLFFNQVTLTENSGLSKLSKLDGISNFELEEVETDNTYGIEVTFTVDDGYKFFGEVVTDMEYTPEDHLSFWTKKEISA